MSEIMQQRSSLDRFRLRIEFISDCFVADVPMPELPDHSTRHIEHAQRMHESRMLGTGIDEVSEPKLMDSPEPLELLGVNQV